MDIVSLDKINKEIKKLDLKIITKNPEDFAKHKIKPFYTAVGTKSNNQKVFFKMSLIKCKSFYNNLSREIETRKFLKKNGSEIKFPKLIASNNTKLYYWFLSEYLEGKQLGSFYQIYFRSPKRINMIIKNLSLLREIDKNQINLLKKNKKFHFYKRDFNSYLKMIDDCQRMAETENIINFKINFKKIKRFFEKQFNYFKEAKYVLSHGDFTMANMIISPDEDEIILTDWEHAHIDNYTYDFARLWIQLWRYPLWRKNMIEFFIESLPLSKIENFKNVFRSVIITEALAEILGSLQICPKKYKKSGIENALKIIDASILGFNNLIK